MVNKGKSIIKECSSDTKMEEFHHYTHLKTGVLALRNYRKLVGGSNEEDGEYNDHSAITMP